MNTLKPSQTSFEQTGLGPGQEYEVSLGIIKNNKTGPQTSANVVTSNGPSLLSRSKIHFPIK